jgi:hypothetical protein
VTVKEPEQPKPNVVIRVGGNDKMHWIVLIGLTVPLIAEIDRLSRQLSGIDKELEIVETPNGLAIRVQPKNGVPRTRTELIDAVKKLAKDQSAWQVKWADA